ncbi:MAG TPA: rhodanese-like domain-containing protein [Burkholderiales bacterium]
MRFINLAGYKFVSLDGLDDLKALFDRRCRELELKGTILLSFEGINVVLAGSEGATTGFQGLIHADPRLADLRFKRSESSFQPFDRMLVKIKKEIITMRVTGVDPAKERAPAIAPSELKRWLDEGRAVVLLDTRNAFEVDAGTFDNAMDLRLSSFGQFAQAVDALDPSLKDKTIVTFCTGGIRCEKAAPVLIGKGFRNVFQLDGGILQYFEECGDAHFKGRCFVFDQRVALDGNLEPAVANTQ